MEMTTGPDNPQPRFVTCECQHCNSGIEFDANQLAAGETRTVECPHCHSETIISVAPMPVSHPAPHPGLKWFFKGAGLGDVESMAHLGVLNLGGLFGVPRNYNEALKWLRQAAEQGDITAQGNLGVCYLEGFQNYSEGEKWIRKAAERGDPVAQYHLGVLYHFGQGLRQNPHDAFTWWLKAAEGGHVTAQNNVGFLYEQGEIIAQDLVEAHMWMSLAAAQGYEGANEHSKAMALKMSTDQQAESQRRIEVFLSKRKEIEQPQISRLIEWLAKMGDPEAQALLVSQRSRAISSEVRREVWRRDQGKCVRCGSRERLEFDHIVPFSEGGSNTARNIELLCETCNRSKSNSIQ